MTSHIIAFAIDKQLFLGQMETTPTLKTLPHPFTMVSQQKKIYHLRTNSYKLDIENLNSIDSTIIHCWLIYEI
jgi:hypothetical protein